MGLGHRHPTRPVSRFGRPRLQVQRLPKWRTFFSIAVTTYALEDQFTSVTPCKDATWLRLDALVLHWLYGSMALDLVDLVMPISTAADAPVATSNMVWRAVHNLFNDNKKTREVYLAEEFCNVKQGDLSVCDYLNRQKAMADALAEVGAPVSDSDLITNVIKGLDERFDSVTNIAPLLTLFPTFLNFRNMLLLQEMKAARRTAITSASAFVATGLVPLLRPMVRPLPVRAGGSCDVVTLITETTTRIRGRTRATSPPLPLPRPLRATRGPAPFRCGLCRSLPAMASSDLARVPTPTPTWRPPTPAMPPLTTRLCTAPLLV
jgi:hypothetical protein